MKKLLLNWLCMLGALSLYSQQVTMDDLIPLLGEWRGTLTYLDYTSQQEVAIPVNLMVEKRGAKSIRLNYSYPDEPQANSRSILKAGGNTLNGHMIVGKSQENRYLMVVTEASGKDNGQAARFTFTYTISPYFFSIRKEVVVQGDSFTRNRYEFSR